MDTLLTAGWETGSGIHRLPGEGVIEGFELSLDQLYLDAERVLGLMRTRGYELVRLKLSAPGACELVVRLAPGERPLLRARLDRLAGVQVTSQATVS